MIITKLLESLMGEEAEFQRITVYLPMDTLADAEDLAAKIGVPTSRLLAEIIAPALKEAHSEWRSVTFDKAAKDESAAAPVFSLNVPPRVK